MMQHTRQRHLLSLTLMGVTLLAGCARSPFSLNADDYGPSIDASRLRSAPRADLDRYRVTTPTTEPPTPNPFEGLERVPLSIEQCRASALEHNLDLKVTTLNPAISQTQIDEEAAKFNAAFTLRALWRELDQPTASQLVSTQLSQQLVEPGVRVPLLTGGSATVSLPMSRTKDTNPFTVTDATYNADAQFSLSQPLLRGAGRRAATAPLRIASLNSQATQAATTLEIIRQLAAVDRAYWRLNQAHGTLDVRLQQLELARQQLDRAKRRAAAGDAAEIEITRAEAGVADSLDAILTANTTYKDQDRELKQIVNLPGLTLRSQALVSPESPPDPVQYQFDRDTLIAQSLDNRMDLLELELRLAADAVNIDLAKNAALPLLSLDYTYRVNGLGDSFTRSYKSLSDNQFTDWELGLSADIPLNNDEARARVRRAVLTRLQRLSTREARELQITREVLAAIDTIDSAWQRILAARQSVILNTRTLTAEQRQFDLGLSTSTNVLDASSRLAEARLAELQALTDYQIAQTDLAFATGTTLGQAQVSWNVPTP
ncbi:MAG: TolC family protein [Phycisphaerales bacterium]